jgi:hypothetical protein
MGDDGADAVALIRLSDMRASNVSSNGRLYSSRKCGCRARFSDGEGERTATGVVEFGSSWYPSASSSCQFCIKTAEPGELFAPITHNGI